MFLHILYFNLKREKFDQCVLIYWQFNDSSDEDRLALEDVALKMVTRAKVSLENTVETQEEWRLTLLAPTPDQRQTSPFIL